LSLIAAGAAVRVITHARPVYSALYFVLVVLAVSGLLLMLHAEFLAIALVLVYAGAILVTYIFVIMLAQQQGVAPHDASAREPFWACLAGFALLTAIGTQLLIGSPPDVPLTGVPSGASQVVDLGVLLMSKYVLAVQVAGVLLLASMVGAIAIAQRKSDELKGGSIE
jgi:NADH-quinone oxidoreductase subunit J